ESEFEPRFLKILQESGVEKDEFEGLEYFTWLPFFVIAGASVKPKIHVHGDHTHFEGAIIEVPDEELELFLNAIPHLLQQAAAAYDGATEDEEG
ncbi:MAG: hypothetical protein Q7T55_15180, partial [Solirubrobacteraceae bacterium]|nr:hypothetical protein [Solirubrobacteraceae bacterium]